jgi:hypothetical protein
MVLISCVKHEGKRSYPAGLLPGVDRIKAQFDAARASAEGEGRRFADLGASASVVVRLQPKEAEARFRGMLKHTDVEALVATLKEAVKRRTTSGSASPPSPARCPTPGLDESAARRPSAKA